MSTPFSGINPFVGLRAFEQTDSLYFFGRREQTAELLEQLHNNRFLAVLGRSGSGKSSLIRAALIPALLGGFLVEDRDKWVIAVMKPGGSPRYNLAKALLSTSAHPVVNADELERDIEHDQDEAITRFVREHIGTDTNVLLLIDQFEEIFQFRGAQDDEQLARLDSGVRQQQASHRQEAADFVDVLLSLPEQKEHPIYVALTMRSDFLGDCDVFYGLPEAMNRSRYLVPRLNRRQLREAVHGPALLSGAKIAPRLLDTVVNDVVGQSDQLPVLQHALLRTWTTWHHSGEKVMDLHHYEAIGGLGRALSIHAEEALDVQNTQLTKTIFQCLTDTDSDKRRIRRPVSFSELVRVTGATPQAIEAVIERFQGDGRSFLITSQGRNDETRIDISHESLIRQWKRLRDWIDEEGYSRDQFLELASRARDKRALLRDPDLEQARRWQSTFEPNQAWANRYSERGDDFTNAITYLSDSTQAVLSEISKKRKRNYSLFAIAALGIVMLSTLYYRALDAESELEETNVKLEEANADLNEANDELNEANDELNEANEELIVTLNDLESARSEAITLLDQVNEFSKLNAVQSQNAQGENIDTGNTTLEDLKPKPWVWNNRQFDISSAILNEQSNSIRVSPGEQFTIRFKWEGKTTPVEKGKDYYCPNCIVQLYYGIGGQGRGKHIHCFVSDIMSPGWSRSGEVKGVMTAPKDTGTYYINRVVTTEYKCEPSKVMLSTLREKTIGARIIVE